MSGFQKTARSLFSEGRRQRRVALLAENSGLPEGIARTYDTAAEANVRQDYKESPSRGRIRLQNMVQADEAEADSRDLFRISVER